jgi:predicted nucleic acid-binding protein
MVKINPLGLEAPPPMATYFFDASAIVKLVVNEPGATRSRQAFDEAGHVCTSWVVIGEGLGVLKRKWLRGEVSDRGYGKAVHLLLALVREGRLMAVDLAVDKDRPALATYEIDIIKTRERFPKLDAADALQFAVIQNTFLRHFVGASKTRLVSADRELLAAARSEGIPVLDVSND